MYIKLRIRNYKLLFLNGGNLVKIFNRDLFYFFITVLVLVLIGDCFSYVKSSELEKL